MLARIGVIGLLVFSEFSFLPGNSHAAENCALQRLVEAPMLQDDYYSPVISVMLDDKPRKVLLDTGGFWSMVTPETAAGLPTRYAPIEGRLGLQGLPMNKMVKFPSVQVGPAKIDNIDFFIMPEGYMERVDGTLGANWLAAFDVEIDPVKNTASLFSKDHCEGQVIYWPHQDMAVVPFTLARGERHVTLSLTLAGKDVKVMIDTGAPESVLSMRAAKNLFGLTPDSPGMQLVGTGTDENGHAHNRYRYQFSSLEMGDIAFKNPWIAVSDISGGEQDMILGMHQMHALHLYFAYGEHKLYATSARGDIAAGEVAGVAATGQPAATASDPLSRINARNYKDEAFAKLSKGDRDGALAAIEMAVRTDPTYSDAYLARADIHAERGERDSAFKDYSRALELNPDNLAVYADRSMVEWQSGDKAKALTDVSQALHHDPTFVRGYLVRAGFELDAKDQNSALADAGEIIRMKPNSPEGYRVRAGIYASLGDYAHAYDDETTIVRLEPKSAVALNDRCWFGAILGKFDDALDDCNAALDIAPKSAAVLDSRGFVRYRKGQWDRAISDYSSALGFKPDQAASLYGRGLAKQQKGDTPGATADIAAAQKVDPQIAQHFGK